LFLFLLLFAGLAPVASAKTLTVCNNFNEKVNFGYAYAVDGKFKSVGWWDVESGSNCKTIEIGAAPNKIYVFASSNGYKDGYVWGGTIPFCVSKSAFAIPDSNTAVSEDQCGGTNFHAYGLELLESNGNFTWNVGIDNIISSHYKLCNQSGKQIFLAKAMVKGITTTRSDGWRGLEPNACETFRVHSGRDNSPGYTAAEGMRVIATSSDNELIWTGSGGGTCMSFSVFDYPDAHGMACTNPDQGFAQFIPLLVNVGINTFNFALGNSKPRQTTINYCNKTNEKVWFAKAYYTDKWTTQGWYSLNPEQCTQISIIKPKNGAFYQFATEGKAYYTAYTEGYTRVWASDGPKTNFCLNTTSTFEYDVNECSAEGAKRYHFVEHSVVAGKNTVEFRNENSTPKTIINLCNDNDFTIYAAYGAPLRPDPNYLTTSGYHTISAKSCTELQFWKTQNIPASGEFRFFAYDYFNSNHVWGDSSKEMCVHSTKSFEYPYSDIKGCNDGGEISVKTMLKNISPGINEVRFGPSNEVKQTEAEFCNRTNKYLNLRDVRYISRNGPDDAVAGARSTYRTYISPGQCETVKITDYNGFPYSGQYYYQADYFDGNFVWSGDAKFCVTFDNSKTADDCESDSKIGFRSFGYVEAGQKIKIDLNPKSADPTSYTYCNSTDQVISASVAYSYKTGFISLGLGSLSAGQCLSKD
ncbi:MAG: DUF1036 domain-containing protein, partial [Proteobacteria bacterium]